MANPISPTDIETIRVSLEYAVSRRAYWYAVHGTYAIYDSWFEYGVLTLAYYMRTRDPLALQDFVNNCLAF